MVRFVELGWRCVALADATHSGLVAMTRFRECSQ